MRAFVQRLQRTRLCRRPERRDRVPLGGGTLRSSAGAGGRTGPARTWMSIVTLDTSSGRSRQSRRPSTIPIVFAIAARSGQRRLVASLARPGGNVTGLIDSDGPIWRQAARTLARSCPRSSADWRSWSTPTIPQQCWHIERGAGGGARRSGCSRHVGNAASASDIDAAFDAHRGARADALYVASRPVLNQPTATAIVALAARHAIAGDATHCASSSRPAV